MFNVCPNCGQYSVEKKIDPTGAYAICPFCDYRHRFLRQPLFVISGASGSGKTSTCLELVPILTECVVLESDILWGAFEGKPEDDYRTYRDMWLRVAKNIGQAGRPVVLCGTALPGQFEDCLERRYFSTLHYLAMVCDDEVLAARLKSRPAWRNSGSDEFVARVVQFNQWLKVNAPLTKPPMTLFDTTNRPVSASVEYVAEWVRERL